MAQERTALFRRVTPEDEGFVREMLEAAANGDPDAERRPLADWAALYPPILNYVQDWGRPGDDGYVALEDGRPIGVAWYRLFNADNAGFGFIDEGTPEFAIGLIPAARGRGTGTRLLVELFDLARSQGYRRISLDVNIQNPALRLYERLGFTKVEDDGDGYRTMVLDLG